MTKFAIPDSVAYPTNPAEGFPSFGSLYTNSAEWKYYRDLDAKHEKKIVVTKIVTSTIFFLLGIFLSSSLILEGAVFGAVTVFLFVALSGPIFVLAFPPFGGEFLESSVVRHSTHLTFQAWVNARYGLGLSLNDARTLWNTEKLFPTTEQGYILVNVQGSKHVMNFDGSEVAVKAPAS